MKKVSLWSRIFGLQPEQSKSTEGLDVWDKGRGRKYRDFWCSVSEKYDEAVLTTYGAPEEGMQENSEWVAKYIAQSLQLDQEKEILEVGCGIGRLAYFLAPLVKRYNGADVSPNMLQFAKERMADADNCTFHELHFSDLREFEDNRFDAVLFEAVLIHMAKEDSYWYMKEAHRVLKPGGRAYFQLFNILHPAGLEYFLRLVESCDRTGENLICRPRFHTAKELRQYLNHIGFEIQEDDSRLEEVEQNNKRHHPHVLNAVVVKK